MSEGESVGGEASGGEGLCACARVVCVCVFGGRGTAFGGFLAWPGWDRSPSTHSRRQQRRGCVAPRCMCDCESTATEPPGAPRTSAGSMAICVDSLGMGVAPLTFIDHGWRSARPIRQSCPTSMRVPCRPPPSACAELWLAGAPQSRSGRRVSCKLAPPAPAAPAAPAAPWRHRSGSSFGAAEAQSWPGGRAVRLSSAVAPACRGRPGAWLRRWAHAATTEHLPGDRRARTGAK